VAQVTAITNSIAPKYGGKGPAIVLGDSDGDFEMMVGYADTQLRVIINRCMKGANIGKDVSGRAGVLCC
jgi:hypothetical protein